MVITLGTYCEFLCVCLTGIGAVYSIEEEILSYLNLPFLFSCLRRRNASCLVFLLWIEELQLQIWIIKSQILKWHICLIRSLRIAMVIIESSAEMISHRSYVVFPGNRGTQWRHSCRCSGKLVRVAEWNQFGSSVGVPGMGMEARMDWC